MSLRSNLDHDILKTVMGYSIHAIKGISWMSAFRVISRGITIAKIAIIARVLGPSLIGVFGIASLVLAFLEMIMETGINIFLIQTKKDITEYIDSAWIVSILRGILIALIIIIIAPLVSSFFNTPEATPLLLLISSIPFIRGFINPAVVKLQRDLQFQYEFWFRTVIFLFDTTISIIIALITQSVFSLAWGMLAGAVLEVILSFIFIQPHPKFKYNKVYFKELFHTGKWVTLFGIFNYLAQEGDKIIVGKVLGPLALGIYQTAYKLSTLPISEITDVVSKVTFPVYTKISADIPRLKRAFIRSTTVIILTTTFLGSIIYLFPKEIILILLGKEWIIAASVLQVLAIYGILRAISGSASAVFLATGKQKYVTGMTFVRFIGLAISIYPFIQLYGLIGAGYAALFSVLVEIPLILYFVYQIFSKKENNV